MGKHKKKLAATAPAADGHAAIDDIFASKPKTAHQPSDAAALSASAKGKQKEVPAPAGNREDEERRKVKKQKSVAGADAATRPVVDTAAKKARVVETVLDPSAVRPKPSVAVEAPADGAKKTKKRERKEAEADDEFADSRGVGPRRKTEEGFLIYKEAELGINPEAGGTPLCPFDCDCCF